MTVSQRDLSGLIGQLYLCIEAPSRWQAALISVMDYLGGSASILFTPLHAPEAGGFWIHGESPGLPSSSRGAETADAIKAFAQDVQNDLYNLTVFTRQATREPTWDSGGSQDQSARIVHNAGMRQISGMLAEGNEKCGKRMLFGVRRGPELAPFTDREIKVAALLLGHLGTAVCLSLQFMEMHQRSRLAEIGWEGLPWAQGFVNGSGSLIHANNALRTILAKGDGLLLINGFIGCRHSEDTKLLYAALQELNSANTAPATQVLRIRRHAGKAEHLLHIMAIDGGEVDIQQRFQIKVVDSLAQHAMPSEMLRQLYRLTSAECRLVEALLAGMSPAAAAAFFEVSSNTVRSQLKAIFLKTGVHRQVELLRLTMGLSVL